MHKLFTTFWGWMLLLACLGVLALVTGRVPKARVPEKFLPDRYMLPQEPVSEFQVKKVKEALQALSPEELVLGVVVGKEARAYPINMLNRQPGTKVLNDTLDGRPVIASWCDRAHNAIVYSREVDGKTLRFGVFGQLWKDSLVMYDAETMTRWSHILGQAKLGPLEGKNLERIPSFITDWASWSRLYSGGTVVILADRETEFTRELYEDVDKYVLGIAADGGERSWTFRELRAQQAINDVWNNRPVLAVFVRASVTARLFRRTVGDRVLTFELKGTKLVDKESASIWEPLTGLAVSGTHTGQRLISLPAIVSHRKVWESFFSPTR
jgi:hypothetical protein